MLAVVEVVDIVMFLTLWGVVSVSKIFEVLE